MLEKTLESPLNSKEIKPVNLKEISPDIDATWIADSEKTLMVEKIEGQEEKGTTEDDMIGWYHWLNGHQFDEALGDGEGQEGLVCCSPWGHKELDMTEWLNNNSNNDKGLSMS